MFIVAGAAAVYQLWTQSRNTDDDDDRAFSGRSSGQEDSVVASLAKGVYEAIENFNPNNPDWVMGTGEDWNSDALYKEGDVQDE